MTSEHFLKLAHAHLEKSSLTFFKKALLTLALIFAHLKI
jgi:hypothetical protein